VAGNLYEVPGYRHGKQQDGHQAMSAVIERRICGQAEKCFGSGNLRNKRSK
jgi:hypothetical protein